MRSLRAVAVIRRYMYYYVWKVRLVSLPWMYVYAGIIDVPGGKNDTTIAAINS